MDLFYSLSSIPISLSHILNKSFNHAWFYKIMHWSFEKYWSTELCRSVKCTVQNSNCAFLWQNENDKVEKYILLLLWKYIWSHRYLWKNLRISKLPSHTLRITDMRERTAWLKDPHSTPGARWAAITSAWVTKTSEGSECGKTQARKQLLPYPLVGM